MGLNHSSVSSQIDNFYVGLKLDKKTDNIKQVPYPKDPLAKWMENYISVYDTDANNGTFSKTSVVMVSSPSLLTFVNTGSACGGANMMGAKLAEYWVSQVTFGSPEYDGIITVSNDASKIEAIIDNYLCTLGTMASTTPHYDHLFSFIESTVNSIVWTVEENNGDSTITYTVSIS